MPRIEEFGTRSWAWSVFHRSMPKPAYMIDMDYIESCQYCKETLIIGELARDVGQHFKPTTILQKLAKKANVVGLLIFLKEEPIISAVKLIKPDVQEGETPKLTKLQLEALWRYLGESQTPVLRVSQVYPTRGTEKALTARQFYEFLCEIHAKHESECPVALKRFPIFGKETKGVPTEATSKTTQLEAPNELERLRMNWRQVIEQAPEDTKRTPVIAILSSAGVKPVAIEGDTVVLAFRYPVHKTKMEQAENLQVAERIISRFLKHSCHVRCIYEPEDDHLVQAALKTGAQIIDVEEK